MGAHMWWSGFDIVDLAGLVDVPMGHHSWEKPFIKEYIFKERNPEFAHVHGGWASRTKMKTHKEWRRYLQIDPYPTSRRYQHTGNHIRKDLIVAKTMEWHGGVQSSLMDGWEPHRMGGTQRKSSGWRVTLS